MSLRRDSGPSRLGLGTVQFGQAYGVSNIRGRVSLEDAKTIIAHAAQAGLSTLDTAAGYGEAEAVLGAVADATRPFRIVTKTVSIGNGVDAVVARARRSVEMLGRRPVDVLLVHAASDLLGPDGPTLWKALLGLRDEGLFGDIGISAYVADDPASLARTFRPAVVQVPVSLLDQRLLRSGALATMKELGVEIHARSIFLQGLLFLPTEKLPVKLKHAVSHLETIRTHLRAAGTTPLQAALAFILNRPEVDTALVGVTASAEFDEIVAATRGVLPVLDWETLALEDDLALTPSRW